jgi:hypothetical protein
MKSSFGDGYDGGRSGAGCENNKKSFSRKGAKTLRVKGNFEFLAALRENLFGAV